MFYYIYLWPIQDLKLLWYNHLSFLSSIFSVVISLWPKTLPLWKSACIKACYVEESLDSLPWFNCGSVHCKASEWAMMIKGHYIWFSLYCTNLRIFGVTRRRERFSWSNLYFLVSSRLYLGLFCLNFRLEIFLWSGKMGII